MPVTLHKSKLNELINRQAVQHAWSHVSQLSVLDVHLQGIEHLLLFNRGAAIKRLSCLSACKILSFFGFFVGASCQPIALAVATLW